MKKDDQFKISFELFPPKTDLAKENLTAELQLLLPLKPAFFSITYGAGGSTQAGSLYIIQQLRAYKEVEIVPHLSCIGSTRAELTRIIKIFQQMGLKHIVALRGDLPPGQEQTGELRYANELVTLIREIAGDHFHIDVAAYPEYHPQAKTAKYDIENFKRKIAAGANGAITQYFYNPDAYFNFLDECAKHGINKPIIPGIMPILSYTRLIRFSELCGAEIPLWMRKRFESYGEDMASIKAFGIEVVTKLCERLIRGGAPGLHFYTLNHAEPTKTIVEMLQPFSKMVLLKNVTAEQKSNLTSVL